MRLLLGSQARTTGACLGSAARIFQAAICDGEGHITSLVSDEARLRLSPISESSYGRGFCLLARRLLPELGQNPVLHQTMEAAVNKGYLNAAQQFSQSYVSLSQLCSCMNCRSNVDGERGYTAFCLLTLIPTICTLVRAMSTICMQQDLKVQPTRSGLESIYWNQRDAIGDPGDSYYDPVVDGLLRPWPKHTLSFAQMLFAGRQYDRGSGSGNVVAASHSGLCFCLHTLTEITSDPQRACVVTVVPGRIEWNGFMYDMIRDQGEWKMSTPRQGGYNAVSMTTVTKYDDLADSSTSGLVAELIIDEIFPESTSLSAFYRVLTAAFPGRHFSLGAAEIWAQLRVHSCKL